MARPKELRKPTKITLYLDEVSIEMAKEVVEAEDYGSVSRLVRSLIRDKHLNTKTSPIASPPHDAQD